MDKGHARLIQDLEELLQEVKKYHYHDSKSPIFVEPKKFLHYKLMMLASNTLDGMYNNKKPWKKKKSTTTNQETNKPSQTPLPITVSPKQRNPTEEPNGPTSLSNSTTE